MTSCALVAVGCRQPHKVMQGERVGRACGEPDGERDRHDGLAQPCAVDRGAHGEAFKVADTLLFFVLWGKATAATTNEPTVPDN